jgi:hypothetical protein
VHDRRAARVSPLVAVLEEVREQRVGGLVDVLVGRQVREREQGLARLDVADRAAQEREQVREPLDEVVVLRGALGEVGVGQQREQELLHELLRLKNVFRRQVGVGHVTFARTG